MNEKDQELIQEGWALFTRIFMKYDILEKAPIEISPGEKLSPSLIHIIEAVGKGYGNTVTTLGSYFMITKGAVSQMITKLHKMGSIAKTKRKGNDKEVVLELTKKGWKVFELHEKLNESTLDDLKKFLGKYEDNELRSFISILTDIEHSLNKFIPQQTNK